jgi:hypothetical protein
LSELNPKQLRAVSGIAKGLTPVEIAKVIGVSSRTIERWQRLPEFVAALSEVQGEVSRRVKTEIIKDASTIACRLEILAGKSLDCLEEIIDNREARGSDRLGAARAILSQWQAVQPATMGELSALEVLIKAGFLGDSHLQKLQESLQRFTSDAQAIFAPPNTP